MESVKNDKRIVLGIDFGNTRSCVAVNVDGEVEVIPSRYHTATIPTCVAFDNGGKDIYVGYDAEVQAISNPKYTISEIKNILGKSYSDSQLVLQKSKGEFTLIDDGNDKPRVVVSKTDGHSKGYSIEQVASYIFSELKWMAEEFLNIEPELKLKIVDAIITVPVSFNKLQRKSIFDAATIAGLNILQIINDPVSALFAYGLPDKCDKETKVLVCKLSETKFYTSAILIKGNECVVLATADESSFSSHDFSKLLVDYCLEGLPSNIEKDYVATNRLESVCEQAVKTLSRKDYTNIDIDYIYGDTSFETEITRDEFFDFTDLINKIIDPITQVITYLNMEKDNVDEVIIAGSGSWIPKAKEILEGYFEGTPIRCDIRPDEAIALGAASFGGNIAKYKLTEEVPPEYFKSSNIDLYSESSHPLTTKNILQKPKNEEIIDEKELERGESISNIRDNEMQHGDNATNAKASSNNNISLSYSSIGGENYGILKIRDQESNVGKNLTEGNPTDTEGKTPVTPLLENIFNYGAAREVYSSKYKPVINKEDEESVVNKAGPEKNKNSNQQASYDDTRFDNKSRNTSNDEDKEPPSARKNTADIFDTEKGFDKHNAGPFADESDNTISYSEALKKSDPKAENTKDQKDKELRGLSIGKIDNYESSMRHSVQIGTQEININTNQQASHNGTRFDDESINTSNKEDKGSPSAEKNAADRFDAKKGFNEHNGRPFADVSDNAISYSEALKKINPKSEKIKEHKYKERQSISIRKTETYKSSMRHSVQNGTQEINKNTNRQASHNGTRFDNESRNTSNKEDKGSPSVRNNVPDRFDAEKGFNKQNAKPFGDESDKSKPCSDALKKSDPKAEKTKEQKDKERQSISIGKTEPYRSIMRHSVQNETQVIYKSTNKQTSHNGTRFDNESINTSKKEDKGSPPAGKNAANRFDAKKGFNKHNSGTFGDESDCTIPYSEARKNSDPEAEKTKEQKDKEHQSLSNEKKGSYNSSMRHPEQNGSAQTTKMASNETIDNDSQNQYSGENDKKIYDHIGSSESIPLTGSNSFKDSEYTYCFENDQKNSTDNIHYGLENHLEGQTIEQVNTENNLSSKQMMSGSNETINNVPFQPSPFSEIEALLKKINDKEESNEVALNIGVRLSSGELCVLIPKNSKLPYYSNKTIITACDGQPDLIFEFWAGARFMAIDNFPLGRCTFAYIPAGFRGQYKYEIHFSLSSNGLLEIQVYQPLSNYNCFGNLYLPLSEFQKYGDKILKMDPYAIEMTDKNFQQVVKTEQLLIELIFYYRNSLFRLNLNHKVNTEIYELTSKTLCSITAGEKTKQEYYYIYSGFINNADLILNDYNITVEDIMMSFSKSDIEPAIYGSVYQYQ